MSEALLKLIDVKTIVTLTFVGTGVILTIIGKMDPKWLEGMIGLVVGYFFGVKQGEKMVQIQKGNIPEEYPELPIRGTKNPEEVKP